MEPNNFINAMYLMNNEFYSSIPNRRARMKFVKAKLKKLKSQKGK